MKESKIESRRDRLRTPRAAGVAGIVFAVLFSAIIILARLSIPTELTAETDWVANGREQISLALKLMPFAGIAFLWFIGVVRDLLGEYEDQFFATVFLGSSLLFLAMVFVSMAIAGGILSSVSIGSGQLDNDDIIVFGRAVMLQITNVYAMRMAGVLMMSLGTLWLRTGVVPRWLVIITYLVAVVLLLVVSLSIWVVLIFPIWVFLTSIFILVSSNRRQADN